MPYDHTDYRNALKDLVLRRKAELGRAFNFQGLAKACRVQKTYISRVMKGEAHLSEDQLFLATEHLALPADAQRFLVLLHQANRCGVARRRERLMGELAKEREHHRKADRHLAATAASASLPDLSAYYLEPEMQLVHMFLTVDRYAQEPARIAADLRLARDDLARILLHLQKLGLVERQGAAYRVVKDSLHLPSDSPLFRPQRALMRLRALERIERGGGEPYAFSVAFSADEATRARVQARFLEFLKAIESDVRAAPASDVYQMSFDLFRWTRSAP